MLLSQRRENERTNDGDTHIGATDDDVDSYTIYLQCAKRRRQIVKEVLSGFFDSRNADDKSFQKVLTCTIRETPTTNRSRSYDFSDSRNADDKSFRTF
jgi:hypothetical protein